MEPRAGVSCFEVGPFLENVYMCVRGRDGGIFIPLFNQKEQKKKKETERRWGERKKRKRKTPEPTHKRVSY